MLEQRKNKTVTKLHEILRPFLLRRVKVDVLKEMPPKKEIVVYSGMSKLQLGYADLIDKGVLRDELLRQGIADGKNLSQTNKMMNHRKNVNHPFIFGEPLDPTTGVHLGTKYPHLLVHASGKFALMDRMLQRLHKGKKFWLGLQHSEAFDCVGSSMFHNAFCFHCLTSLIFWLVTFLPFVPLHLHTTAQTVTRSSSLAR